MAQPFKAKTNFHRIVTETCLKAFADSAGIDPIDLSTAIMDLPDFPMHADVHHYLVPAVLLTAARKAQGRDIESLRQDLDIALERAKKVPGGTCGFFGSCGASVGVGIFMSILTDASPLSVKPWEMATRGTADALNAIAEVGGPRCCKRCSWLSLLSIKPRLENDVRLPLNFNTDITCEFHERNNECIRKRCPFYPELAAV